MLYNNYMLLTYQFKLNPTPEQAVTLETWGELLRRHWNYALGERLDWLKHDWLNQYLMSHGARSSKLCKQ
ncbi:helix-turn-helix domain-containing protein [Nostoc sp. LEGE 12450]|uniref:helix-turn-helix domain-containing protein n=1 Tax=Nostoc sp. LEGE 12450 TaxID=1828643 RepID=UPI00187EB694|nr:helix-turn-helix domain-containing protein [Nostoc sp. LEGE 12450]MBE8992175.1 helix-turn-helix domain-containing protein [Nostoc sp. LEGE 12450]